MPKKQIHVILFSASILAAVTLVRLAPGAIRLLAQDQRRAEPRMPTLTTLPEFPKLPITGLGLSKEQKDGARQTLVNHKVQTYPTNSARGYRAGKFTSTGIFGGFPPTEDQIARIAPHYDDILFGAARKDFIPRFKKYNPELTFFIYVDSGLKPGFKQSDAGGVDAEDLNWVIQQHPDWILKDKDGNFIRSGTSRLGNKGEYCLHAE